MGGEMKESKKIYEFTETEIKKALTNLPNYIADWMKEVGIKYGSDMNDGYDIYEPTKKAIFEQWETAQKKQKRI